ncbi:transglycosylase family protein [Streptomyces sp. NPDC002018]|uniref:resuscitation-promoting factor n=1 Tax=Streptomyces sp. NPDC002018 TaxID=3364629 RepID=UPI003675648B
MSTTQGSHLDRLGKERRSVRRGVRAPHRTEPRRFLRQAPRRLLPRAPRLLLWRAPRGLLPQALVVALLAGGTSALVVGDRSVGPSDGGGEPRAPHTAAPAPRALGARAIEARALGVHALGVRADHASLSVSRSSTVSRGALTAQAGPTPHDEDSKSVPRDGLPLDGRAPGVVSREQTSEEAVPYDTVRTDDPALFRGTEVIDQPGSPGVRRVVYGLRTIDGIDQQPRVLHEEMVRAPVTQRVRVGTKALPTSMAGVDHLNWKGLAACESSGRVNAVDPSGKYGGLYQFDLATWRSVGGRGRPQDATAEEQTLRAKKLYMQRGASPWPYCGRRLTR